MRSSSSGSVSSEQDMDMLHCCRVFVLAAVDGKSVGISFVATTEAVGEVNNEQNPVS